MEYYQIIKKERKSQNMTLAKLSELTNISVPYLSKLENYSKLKSQSNPTDASKTYKLTPSFEQIVSIASALKIDIQSLAYAMDKNYKPQNSKFKSPKAERIMKHIRFIEDHVDESLADNLFGRMLKIMPILKDTPIAFAITDHDMENTSFIKLPFYDDKIVDYIKSVLNDNKVEYFMIHGTVNTSHNIIPFEKILEEFDRDYKYYDDGDDEEYNEIKTRYDVLYKEFEELCENNQDRIIEFF